MDIIKVKGDEIMITKLFLKCSRVSFKSGKFDEISNYFGYFVIFWLTPSLPLTDYVVSGCPLISKFLSFKNNPIT